MSQSKPLFIPWLKQQIDSGQYPGVNWVNQECTQFSIPWKHALRQDSNSDDSLIFKAWAQTSVDSNGQIPGDASVWKRNFRSALRARGFKLVNDNKNDAANPHKIFMWTDDSQYRASTEVSPGYNADISFGDALYLGAEELCPRGNSQPDLLEQCLAGLNIESESQPELPVDHLAFVTEPEPLSLNTVMCNSSFPIQETSNMHYCSSAQGGQISPVDGMLGQYSPPEVAFMGTQQQHVPQTDFEPKLPVQASSNDPGSQFGTHFKVNIYYRGKQVLSQLVENEAGFSIVFRKDPSPMANPLPVVELPGTESILDPTQAQLTQNILNNLGGLEVKRDGGMLFAHRWGESRVYWSLDKHEQGLTPRPLSKHRPEHIYALKDFVSGMMQLLQNHGKLPSYSLYFFLGEKWPDPKQRPWEKKLIVVEVVLTALEKLKMMAVEGGASSLQSSVELQISLEQMMEMW